MAGLFWCMMKEEWRVHSTMFGSVSFALFPVMIGAIAFMGSFLLPLIQSSLTPGNLAILLHSNYILLGFMVGAFGLLGNEAMNRRFGQASLLAYAARSLPLSDRYIFTIFVIKDTCYYFLLWVLPFGLGFLAASPCIGIPFQVPILLTISLTLSFLTGLSVVFFLSSVYGRSRPALTAVLISCTLLGTGFHLLTGKNPVYLFPSISLTQGFSWEYLTLSSVMITVLLIISLLLFVPEYASSSKRYQPMIRRLTGWFSFFPSPSLVAKDLIDLHRSGSAIGQTLFSFLIPLVVIWFFLSLTSGFLPVSSLLFLFAITTGVIASTMYTWLTAFDSYTSYACLPIPVSTVITGKISSFSLLQAIPVIFMSIISMVSGQSVHLIPAVVLCISISYYALGVTIWLSGLSPHILVYDVTVMIRYFILLGIAAALFSSLAFMAPVLALGSVILIIPAWFFIRIGCQKWDRMEQVSF